MKALVIGATGLVGSEVVKLLIQDNDCSEIHTISRKTVTQNQKIIEHVINLDQLESLKSTLDSKFKSKDFAICCLGTTIKTAGTKEAFRKVDYEYVLNFAKLCQAIGIEKFGVVSAAGANSNSAIFYSKVKGDMEADLVKLNFKHLVIARPGLLLGERKEHRSGEKIAMLLSPIFNWMLIGPLAKVRSVKATDVAKSLIYNLKISKDKIQFLEGNSLQGNL